MKTKKPKPKKINYSLIDRDDEMGKKNSVYKRLDGIVRAHHHDLIDARIALAWRYDVKPDQDGHVELGKCRKASDLDRQLHNYDFVILLNYTFWQSTDVEDQQRDALLDHELCHAAVALDEDGEIKQDEGGRTVYRIRKHDVEEFNAIVKRHGLWTHQLQAIAKNIIDKQERPLLRAMGE